MTLSSRHTAVQTVHALPAPDAVRGLAGRLAAEMGAAWRRGRRPRAEEFLTRHAELSACPEAAVQLVYEEVCLRQEFGPAATAGEILGRFPQWRAELEVLLDCHRLLHAAAAPPDFPRAGDRFGDFLLESELGRGAQGRVFLATQPDLAGRPVVLKLTARDNPEHLALARLQHPHVVPLFWVQDHPDRNLRALCLPYLGGATLARLLKTLAGRPPAERTGRDLLDALDRAQAQRPFAAPGAGPARPFLAGASYARAVCWVGACLADALHHVHASSLVHLDLKPANVLLSAGALPVLFDFHLARPPLSPGDPVPEWFGGTPEYMSPEQRQAVEAVRRRRPVEVPVDGRSDLYSLGLLLYEALAATAPWGHAGSTPRGVAYHEARDTMARAALPRLEACHAGVSAELADLIHHCLSPAPEGRPADAATLAEELRRYAAGFPIPAAPLTV
jgi:serine/threonine protein kinase